MGLVQHHALIATTPFEERIEKAKAWIDLLEPEDQRFFLISPRGVNGETSIVLFPDGSNEGWPQSEQGDVRREQFIEQVLKKDSGWQWVEVTFGELGHKITRWARPLKGDFSAIGDLTELASKVENTIAGHFGFIGTVRIVLTFTLPPDYSRGHFVHNLDNDISALALTLETANGLKQRKVNGS